MLRPSGGRPREGRSALLWLAAFASIPVLIAFTASQLLPTAVWGQRHFIIASVAYLTLVAVAALQIRPQAIRYAVVATLVVWAGAAGWQAERSPYKQVGLDDIARRLSAMTAASGTPARLYVNNDDDGCVLGFFLNRSGVSNVDVALLQPASEPLDHVAGANVSLMAKNRLAADRAPITPASPPNVPLAVIRDVRDLPGNHFWIADDVDPGDGRIDRSSTARAVPPRRIHRRRGVHHHVDHPAMERAAPHRVFGDRPGGVVARRRARRQPLNDAGERFRVIIHDDQLQHPQRPSAETASGRAAVLERRAARCDPR